MEEWKDIVGYEGLYQVSTLGRVKSLARKDPRGHQLKGKYLKPNKDTQGYYRVSLSKDGIVCRKGIHRLVAETFIDNPCDYPQVNHKDEQPTNNQVDNLEWCTAEYNTNYGTRNQRVSEAKKGQPRSENAIELFRHKVMKKVQCVETGQIFESVKSAEEFMQTKTIHHALKGRQKTSGGYHWRYA